jgi:serine/threonine protein kinase
LSFVNQMVQGLAYCHQVLVVRRDVKLETALMDRHNTDPSLLSFVNQMVQGLAYCHQALVVHRDVKLENVLMDRQRNMKLIDFGLSAFLNPGKKLRVHCGSPSYAAPEIISRKLYDGPPCDVWSLGTSLLQNPIPKRACCGLFILPEPYYPP